MLARLSGGGGESRIGLDEFVGAGLERLEVGS